MWSKYDVNEWTATINGKTVDVERSKPFRSCAVSRRHGVTDTGAAWVYHARIDFGLPVKLTATTLRAAKSEAAALV